MNWKEEIRSFGIIIGVFAFLYLTGLMTPIMGGLQSLVLSTGLVKPKINKEILEHRTFEYTGTFINLQGETVELNDYRGKTLFVNLWATWCPPCRAEMPHISELYKKVQDDEQVEFLMIALDKDFEKSKKYIADKGFGFPVFHASNGLNRTLQSQSIPTTLVINPKGEVVFYHEGMSNFNTQEFEAFLLSQ